MHTRTPVGMGLLCLATSSRPYSPGQPVNSPTLRRASGAAGMLAERPLGPCSTAGKAPLSSRPCARVPTTSLFPYYPPRCLIIPGRPHLCFSYAQHTATNTDKPAVHGCMLSCPATAHLRTCLPGAKPSDDVADRLLQQQKKKNYY